MQNSAGLRTYCRRECVVFLKTHEAFGGLSNMAGGYPVRVNGARLLTSEALYQACRFPHLPDVQKLIIGQASPMAAKMKSKPYRKQSRPDFDRMRICIMRWCLQVKLAQNWARFGDLLGSTGNLDIVEESRRDPFWGARPLDATTMQGTNMLGRLLTELREQLRFQGDKLLVVPPPNVPDFLLLGKPIGVIDGRAAPDATLPRESEAKGAQQSDGHPPSESAASGTPRPGAPQQAKLWIE